MFQSTGRRLIWRRDAQTLWIEPWGENSLRVRATAEAAMPESAKRAITTRASATCGWTPPSRNTLPG